MFSFPLTADEMGVCVDGFYIATPVPKEEPENSCNRVAYSMFGRAQIETVFASGMPELRK
jgi:hypothetical protein